MGFDSEGFPVYSLASIVATLNQKEKMFSVGSQDTSRPVQTGIRNSVESCRKLHSMIKMSINPCLPGTLLEVLCENASQSQKEGITR